VVRRFDDADVHHVSGTIDPVRDIEVINTELMLADLEVVQKRRERLAKDAKRGDKGAVAEDAVLAKIEAAINDGKPALTVKLSPEERALSAPFFLLSDKPTIFACNVKEGDLATADTNPYVMKVRDYVRTHLSCEAVVISAQIESDLVDLAPDEADAFLKELGVQESGIGALIRSTYHLLGLQTYFTAGEKEVRAWTIHQGDTAPKAAGVIHSDFERGFIKAETVAYTDLLKCGSVAVAREKGVYRMEGKGALRCTKRISNANIFEAAVSRDAAENTLIDELLSLFRGRSKPVMARLVESGELTLDDIKEAEKSLRRLSKKGKTK